MQEIVKNKYNKEFQRAQAIEKRYEEKSKAAASVEKVEGAGKTGELTLPKPVDYSTVPLDDVWRTAEQGMIEKLKRLRNA